MAAYLRLVETDYGKPAPSQGRRLPADEPTVLAIRKLHFNDLVTAIIAGVLAAWITD